MNRRIAGVVAVTLALLSSLASCGYSLPTQLGQPSERQGALRTVAGYVAPWDARGVTSLGEGALTEVSPVWYQPMPDGSVTFASQAAQQSQASLVTQTSAHRIAILPSISNYVNGQWDGSLIHQLVTDPQLRATHIAAIADLVRAQQWAGIDIDYESLRASDRQAYATFIQELAATLHQAGKRLTVTAHAKTAEPGDWSGARAQDWSALGAAADEVRVMAYDYSTETSAPGPIAPLDWTQRVLQLAVAEIPRDKIVLGLATYGYDWASNQETQDVQWADAEAIAHANAATIQWDSASQSPWFTYTDKQGHFHTVWYENARSLQAKLDLATQSRIGGVVIWRLGGEDPAIWAALRKAT